MSNPNSAIPMRTILPDPEPAMRTRARLAKFFDEVVHSSLDSDNSGRIKRTTSPREKIWSGMKIEKAIAKQQRVDAAVA